MPDRIVYVVAKAPRVGAVKTRLCPPLRPEQAVELYRAFLLDCLELAARVPDTTVQAICPDAGQAAELAPIMPKPCGLVTQREPGLSAALEQCFRDGLVRGHRAVAVIASDNPTLPPDLIEQAFARLERDDVVFGPADDGGYYLVAARAVHRSLFHQMVWSTPIVLDETLRRARAADLRAGLIAPWYDVDTPEALHDLAAELERLPLECARHTRLALGASGVRGQESGARGALLNNPAVPHPVGRLAS